MARKKKHEEHENHERWLVSYADFITLLFAFFVVMYSTSSVNEGKMRVLSDSLVASFAARNKSLEPIQVGNLVRSPYSDDVSLATSPDYIVVAPPDARQMLGDRPADDDEGFIGGDLAEDVGTGTGTGDFEPAGATLQRRGDGDGVAGDEDTNGGSADAESGGEGEDGEAAADGEGEDELADLSEVAASVKDALSPLFENDAVQIRSTPNWLEVEIKTRVLFVSGSARLANSAVPILTELARLLKSFSNPVQVEGFTDNVPIRTLAYPSNWELSAARAASVVHLLMKNGINPGRMSAIGYGEYRPVADNRTPEGRAKNRRVVIIVPADDKVRRVLDMDRIANSTPDD